MQTEWQTVQTLIRLLLQSTMFAQTCQSDFLGSVRYLNYSIFFKFSLEKELIKVFNESGLILNLNGNLTGQTADNATKNWVIISIIL